MEWILEFLKMSLGLDWIEGKSWEVFGGEDWFCGCVSSQGRENKVQRKRMEKRREEKGRNISTKKDSRESKKQKGFLDG